MNALVFLNNSPIILRQTREKSCLYQTQLPLSYQAY